MAGLSEDAFLSLIDRHFPNQDGRVPLGRGDDCAVIRPPAETCLCTDLFIEDSHFRTAYFLPGEAGRKALAVNVSDAAAMGARPLGFCLALMVRPGLSESWWDRFFAGMAALAGEHGLPLVGGDLSRADKAGCAVTLWGERPEGGRFLERGNTRPGDALFVVGELGLARAGLADLEAMGRDKALATRPACATAHLSPKMRVREALALSRAPQTRSLMDVSDGLARDIPRLLGPGQGADLDIPEDRLHPELAAWCAENGLDPVQEAAMGGEDYALLGAVAPEDLPGLVKAVPGLYTIGTASEKRGLAIRGTPLNRSGFDHFAKE